MIDVTTYQKVQYFAGTIEDAGWLLDYSRDGHFALSPPSSKYPAYVSNVKLVQFSTLEACAAYVRGRVDEVEYHRLAGDDGEKS